jgi:methyl-accepting chemotaxis protein
MDVLGDSSDAIMGVVENLANISEKNAESTEDTMASALDMTSTMEELEYSSGKLRELASRLDQSLEIFKM